MAFEVALVATVVSAEVSDRVVTLGAGVKDILGMMGETGKVAAVFMRQNRLDVGAFTGRVDLKGVVGTSSDEKLTLFIKVEGCYVGVRLGEFEQLGMLGSQHRGSSLQEASTFVGLSVPMTSLVFSVLSPFGTSAGGGSLGGGGGGGGGPGAMFAALLSRTAAQSVVEVRGVHPGATGLEAPNQRALPQNDCQVERTLAGWPLRVGPCIFRVDPDRYFYKFCMGQVLQSTGSKVYLTASLSD